MDDGSIITCCRDIALIVYFTKVQSDRRRAMTCGPVLQHSHDGDAAQHHDQLVAVSPVLLPCCC
jgi:hypothetical protein